MTKVEVSRLLRAARDLMNAGGRHWARGRLTRTVRGERSFCAIGAIDTVAGVRPSNEKIRPAARPALQALANAIWDEGVEEGLHPYRSLSDTNVLNAIMQFNDDSQTSWEDLKRVFTRAAKKPKFE
jgi:hypothetical protein